MRRHQLGVLAPLALTVLILCLAGCEEAAVVALPPTTSPLPTLTPVRLYQTGPWGLPLYCPRFVALDRQGNLYVTDTNQTSSARVVKLSPTGRLLWEVHLFTVVGDRFGPAGIAVDPRGLLDVADTGDNTLKQLSLAGALLRTYGGTGLAPGKYTKPLGVAVDAQGTLYVVDSLLSRIEKRSPRGQVVAIIGQAPPFAHQLNQPQGIALDAQGQLYVADTLDDRIVEYAPDGTFLHEWGHFQVPGTGPGHFNHPEGLAVDAQGNLYIADMGNQRLVKLSPAGQVLASWPVWAQAVALDPQGDLYVAVHSPPGLVKRSATGQTLATWPATCA